MKLNVSFELFHCILIRVNVSVFQLFPVNWQTFRVFAHVSDDRFLGCASLTFSRGVIQLG